MNKLLIKLELFWLNLQLDLGLILYEIYYVKYIELQEKLENE